MFVPQKTGINRCIGKPVTITVRLKGRAFEARQAENSAEAEKKGEKKRIKSMCQSRIVNI